MTTIEKVQECLSKDLMTNKELYKTTYKLVFGRPYTGCSCMIAKIRIELINWLKTQ